MKSRAPRAILVVSSLFTLSSFAGASAGDVTMAKDSIRIGLDTRFCYGSEEGRCKNGDFVVYPEISFELNGEIPSGGQPWVEFTAPNTPVVHYDAYLEEVWNQENRWKVTAGGGHEVEAALAVGVKDKPGTFSFTVGLRNELMETNAVIYEGTFIVGKTYLDPNNEETATFYVNDDWRLPIGYLYFEEGRGLHVVTFYRGRQGGVKTYLFHDGKEVANNEGCGIGSEADFDPNMLAWWEEDCTLIGVYGDAESAANGYEPNYDLSAHPGDYEIKCLAGGKLARVIKFTVSPDGSLDNGLAAANELGSNRVMVPVTVRLDVPVWNKEAWKTGAFYGHPLAEFPLPE